MCGQFPVTLSRKRKVCLCSARKGRCLSFTTKFTISKLKCSGGRLGRTLGSRVSGLCRASGLCFRRDYKRTTGRLGHVSKVSEIFFAGDNNRTGRNTLGTTEECTCAGGAKECRFVTVRGSFRKEDFKTISIAKRSSCQRPFRPIIPNIEFTRFGSLSDIGTLMGSGAYTVVLRPLRNRKKVGLTARRFVRKVHGVYSRGKVLVVYSRIRYKVKEAKGVFT